MASPDFIRRVSEDDDPLVQFNVQIRRSQKLWIKKMANRLGKKQSELVRQILVWAVEEADKEMGRAV